MNVGLLYSNNERQKISALVYLCNREVKYEDNFEHVPYFTIPQNEQF